MSITLVIGEAIKPKNNQASLKEEFTSYSEDIVPHLKEIVKILEKRGPKSKEEEQLFDLAKNLLSD